MAQRYLAEVREGDKRILLVEGEPIGARPPGSVRVGDVRSNLHVGGKRRPGELPRRQHDRRIIETIAPALRRDGLFFVGIDVIGGYLTEVNVTSSDGGSGGQRPRRCECLEAAILDGVEALLVGKA